MNFISNDKLTINLPVPLGSTVFTFLTTCNDTCMFQREAFSKAFPNIGDGRCSRNMPCHTNLYSVFGKTFSLSNLETVLDGWGERYFQTELEARNAGLATVESHKQQLKNLGITVE